MLRWKIEELGHGLKRALVNAALFVLWICLFITLLPVFIFIAPAYWAKDRYRQ